MSSAIRASSSHSSRWSVTPGGRGRPRRAGGGWWGEGRPTGWWPTCTYRMPSFSATDRAPAVTGNGPVASNASQPSAAAATVPNWAPINAAARSARPAAEPGTTVVTSGRTGAPVGTISTPTPANSSTNSSSGGAHTRTSTPNSRSRTASPTIGSTLPRAPYVDNSTRIP